MSAYVFNTSHIACDIGENITKIKFEPFKPSLNFNTGDSIIILDPKIAKSPIFIGKGYLNNVVKKNLPSTPIIIRNEVKQIPNFEYELRSVSTKPFKSYNGLDDYAYSLGRIYRYQNPIVQFRRPYTNLNELDSDTLQNEWIYVSRTVFGRLLNSLPRLNKLDFVTNIIKQYETDDLRAIPYLIGLKHLKEYIEERILYRGKYLVETRNNIMNKLSSVINETRDIGFVLANEKTESLSKQAELFDKVFQLESVFIKVKEGIEYSEKKYDSAADHFNTVFKNTSWPIDLNKDE